MFGTLFRQWLYYITAWCILTLAFSVSTIFSLRIYLEYFDLYGFLQGNELALYTISDYQFFEGLLFGVIFGTFFFVVNVLIDRTGIHRMSYGKVILTRIFFYTLSLVIVYFIMFHLLSALNIFPDDFNLNLVNQALSPLMILFLLVFFAGGSLLINFFWQVNKSYGPGGIIQMLLGQYHKPQTEHRIFVFLDLKDSTKIAEELGHIDYCRLIQNVFRDLNHVVQRYSGEIYQYIGDAVVITWAKRFGLKGLRCINFFYAFQTRIADKASYYKKHFHFVPEFKAGINLGEVTVAEIGEYKRELAFYGDVLNTAARIQDVCNIAGKKFLSSKSMAWWIPKNGKYKVESIGEFKLKGKLRKEELFSIEPNYSL